MEEKNVVVTEAEKVGFFAKIGRGIKKAHKAVRGFMTKHPVIGNVIVAAVSAGAGYGARYAVEEIKRRPKVIDTTFSDEVVDETPLEEEVVEEE